MSAPHYTILGAGGFIGGRLARELRQSGAECYVPPRGDEGIFSKDLGCVFYCIGLTADYRDRPFDTVEAHVSFLSRVLEKSKFEKLIYLSSTRLYDGLSGEVCCEDDDLKLNPASPRHLYDLSKALGENLCLTASGGRARVARLAAVYDVSPEATGFLPGILRQLPTGRRIEIDSSSGVSRDYVCLDDVIKSLLKMSQTTRSDIINIASGENISNQDIADTLSAAGLQVSIKHQSEREVRPRCDISKMQTLGINPLPVKTYIENLMKAGYFNGSH